MKIETTLTAGYEPAFEAMRDPMSSWAKNDSFEGEDAFEIGPKDKELSLRLQNAGPEHAKHLRQIMVWARITAPRYWWTEFDTYRVGVEKLSTSTMHKLLARPLTIEDFAHESDNVKVLESTIDEINSRMTMVKTLKDQGDLDKSKEVWREIIQMLPQSYLQLRHVMLSYAALRNIIKQRTGHKLHEWAQFIDWCKTLPDSWMLFDN
mgnify:CR=1 FL=1